jgi:hypothetical protein
MSLVMTLSEQLKLQGRGAYIGMLKGSPFFGEMRDSLCVIGPPGSGKSTRLIAQSVAAFPGLVVVTTCRSSNSLNPDIPALTVKARQELAEATGGRVVDLRVDQAMKAFGQPAWWDVVAGCDVWEVALERARALVLAAIADGDIDNAVFFREQIIRLVAPMLYACCLAGETDSEFVTRMRSSRLLNVDPLQPSFAAVADALAKAKGDAHVAVQWLRAFCEGDRMTPATRANLLSVLDAQILRLWEAEPEVERTLLDIDSLLTGISTIYIQAREDFAKTAAPLVAAFIQGLTSTWRAKSRDERPHAMLLALDEVANVAPLHTLPNLMATAGGDGIQVILGVQDVDLLVDRWGMAGESITRGGNQVILPGYRNAKYLEDISRLLPASLRRESAVVTVDGSKRVTRDPSRERLRRERKLIEEARAQGSELASTLAVRKAVHDIRLARLRSGVSVGDASEGAEEWLGSELAGTFLKEEHSLRHDLEPNEIYALKAGTGLLIGKGFAGIVSTPGWWESTYWRNVLGRG